MRKFKGIYNQKINWILVIAMAFISSGLLGQAFEVGEKFPDIVMNSGWVLIDQATNVRLANSGLFLDNAKDFPFNVPNAPFIQDRFHSGGVEQLSGPSVPGNDLPFSQ